MTMCSNCGVYEAQPDGLCVKCQSITNNEIMAFDIARKVLTQSASDLARLQVENARLTAENEQLRTEASRRLDVIQHQQNVVLQMLNDENKRLREALEWYADRRHYTDEWRNRLGEPDCTPDILIDEGGRAFKALAARKALGGE